MTLPLVACVRCAKTIEDSEVKEGTIRLCEHCDAVPWYHGACVDTANCPSCGTALTVADEWSTRQPKLDQSKWAGEDRPAQQVADSWEDTVGRPTDYSTWWTQLYTFLQNPPTVSEWEYLGYKTGGHDLRWYGESPAVFGIGVVDVHFHVHFNGRYTSTTSWCYGSAWITDVTGVFIKIEDYPDLKPTLRPIVDQYMASMTETENSIQKAKDSWR